MLAKSSRTRSASRRTRRTQFFNRSRSLCLEPLEHRMVLSAIITVTTDADNVTPNDGFVSLREALAASNANSTADPDITAQIAAQPPGTTLGPGDTIQFNIP